MFSGTVTFFGSQEHDFVLTSSQAVRFEIVEITARLIDVTFGDFDPIIVLSLGRRDDEGTCQTTFQSSVSGDEDFVLSLAAAEYCLLMSDFGTLPEDAIVDYVLTMSRED